MSDPISNKGEFGKALQALMMRMGKPDAEQRKAQDEYGRLVAEQMQQTIDKPSFNSLVKQMDKAPHDVRPDI